MILGSGLIANSLQNNLIDHTNFLIFACGVSNSQENKLEEYKREFNFLKDQINSFEDKKLIYFSTVSINSTLNTPYIVHKKFIEEYIQNNVKNYLILRLPNIVGYSNNTSQLINYFYNCLINKQEVTINIDCIRYLIDVDDLTKIIDIITKKNITNTTLNIAFNNGIKLEEILNILENTINLKFSNVIKKNNSIDYIVNNSFFLEQIEDLSCFNLDPIKIIKKYFKPKK